MKKMISAGILCLACLPLLAAAQEEEKQSYVYATYLYCDTTRQEEADKIGREVSSRGMQIPSVYGGPIPVNKSLQEGIAGLKKLIDACVAAGARSPDGWYGLRRCT